MADDRNPIILLVGPTAGGKTALAVELCRRLPGGGECISADSMQVYREMDIGTAKPTGEERREVVHHLIDIVDPDEDGFNVDVWLGRCEDVIAEIRTRGSWPVVVGGTNLYVQALLRGMFDGPPPDETLRRELGVLDERALHARLEAVDPEAASRIHLNDRKRAIRALEVHASTGQPITALQGQWDGAIRDDVVLIGLRYEVPTINRRINERVRAMVDAGLIEEVERLHGAGRLGVQAREALGYKQVIDFLEGRCSREDAVEQIKIRTRRFAKQQRTWLRRFRGVDRSLWIEAGDQQSQDIAKQAVAHILATTNRGGSGESRSIKDG